MRISDWSSDVCSSDLAGAILRARRGGREGGKKEHFARFRREGFCLFSDRAGRGHLTGPAWPAGLRGELPPAYAQGPMSFLWFASLACTPLGARVTGWLTQQSMTLLHVRLFRRPLAVVLVLCVQTNVEHLPVRRTMEIAP